MFVSCYLCTWGACWSSVLALRVGCCLLMHGIRLFNSFKWVSWKLIWVGFPQNCEKYIQKIPAKWQAEYIQNMEHVDEKDIHTILRSPKSPKFQRDLSWFQKSYQRLSETLIWREWQRWNSLSMCYFRIFHVGEITSSDMTRWLEMERLATQRTEGLQICKVPSGWNALAKWRSIWCIWSYDFYSQMCILNGYHVMYPVNYFEARVIRGSRARVYECRS